MSYIPDGFQSVVAYLTVPDAVAFFEFCQKALGATELRIGRGPNGEINHGEMLIEGTAVEFGQAKPEWPARPAALHVFVPNVDVSFARAVSAGAEVLYPVIDNPYGERSGGVSDPFGNHWYLATVTDPVARHKVD